MEAKLIQIGNSKGVRLPKKVIEKYHLVDLLELEEVEEGVIIKPVSTVRKGWDKLFADANKENSLDDDFSDLSNLTSDFDSAEWTW